MTHCTLGDGELLAMRLQDEAGKIDLNVAKDELLRALFVGLGLSAEDASARVDAIADFKDGDSDKRLNGAERDEYAAAGLTAGPKNAPFEAVEELAGVIGFDAETVRKLRPFVTVHSEQDGVAPSAVSPELAELLVRGASDGLESSATFSDGSRALPSQFTTASAKRAYGISAQVETRRGARFVREAVVRLLDPTAGLRPRAASQEGASVAALPYRIWRWRRGETFYGAAASAAAGAPPC